MKVKNYIIISGIIACSSCFSSRTVKTQPKTQEYEWGFRWSQWDSTGSLHYQGVIANRNCFPGFEQYENNYKEIAIEIYDKWGKLQYSSTAVSENWICNDDPNTNYREGTYIYRLITETETSPSKKDTITGQIVILKK